jgi:DNA-binding response OmpR family regulator
MPVLPDPISILLVDDEPLILMDLEFAAEDRGFTPCCASCVGEAMNHIDEGVDVAVLDFNLVGGENCLPIARELTKRSIPYIIHSGDADRQEDVFDMLEAVYVPKPASSDKVIATALVELRNAQNDDAPSAAAAQ